MAVSKAVLGVGPRKIMPRLAKASRRVPELTLHLRFIVVRGGSPGAIYANPGRSLCLPAREFHRRSSLTPVRLGSVFPLRGGSQLRTYAGRFVVTPGGSMRS